MGQEIGLSGDNLATDFQRCAVALVERTSQPTCRSKSLAGLGFRLFIIAFALGDINRCSVFLIYHQRWQG